MQGEVKTGAAIDAYVSKKNPKLKPVTDAVRALVRKAVPKSREAINPWGIPTFEWNGTLCYIMVGKNHVTLVFPVARRCRTRPSSSKVPGRICVM